MTRCKHWSDCGVVGGGCCEAGVYMRPSFGVCDGCPVNTSLPSPVSAATFKASRGQGVAVRKQTIIEKALAYAKAEASLLLSGPLTDRDYDARIRVCLACDQLEVSDDEIGHCGKCGCGHGRRAALTVKGRMPAARCPLNKWPEYQPGAEVRP